MGADQMRLQVRQVDFHDLVIVLGRIFVTFRVGGQERAVLFGQGGQFPPAGSRQIAGHRFIIGESGGSSPQFGSHIADGAFAGGADAGRPGAEVFDDGVGGPGYGQQAGQTQDDVFGGRPAAQFSGQAHADKAGIQHFPRQAGHHFHGVGPAHAYRYGTQAAAVGRMGIGANHQLGGKGVIFQGDLMDDAGARPPKAHAVLGRRCPQEVIDLAVFAQGLLQILRPLDPGLDQMVAVHRSRHGGGRPPGLHKLEHGRLPQHILQDDPIRPQLNVGFPPGQGGMARVVQMGQQDFVGQGQRRPAGLPRGLQVLVQSLIKPGNQFPGRRNRWHKRHSPTLFCGSCGSNRPAARQCPAMEKPRKSRPAQIYGGKCKGI